MNQFRVVEYSYERVEIFDDTNGPLGNPNHPLMKGVAYVDKGSQPTKNPCLGSLLQEYYGFVLFFVNSVFQNYPEIFHQQISFETSSQSTGRKKKGFINLLMLL